LKYPLQLHHLDLLAYVLFWTLLAGLFSFKKGPSSVACHHWMPYFAFSLIHLNVWLLQLRF
jgi:hypothetical protein